MRTKVLQAKCKNNGCLNRVRNTQKTFCSVSCYSAYTKANKEIRSPGQTTGIYKVINAVTETVLYTGTITSRNHLKRLMDAYAGKQIILSFTINYRKNN